MSVVLSLVEKNASRITYMYYVYLEGEGTTTCCTTYIIHVVHVVLQSSTEKFLMSCMPCHECTPHACICVCTYQSVK